MLQEGFPYWPEPERDDDDPAWPAFAVAAIVIGIVVGTALWLFA